MSIDPVSALTRMVRITAVHMTEPYEVVGWLELDEEEIEPPRAARGGRRGADRRCSRATRRLSSYEQLWWGGDDHALQLFSTRQPPRASDRRREVEPAKQSSVRQARHDLLINSWNLRFVVFTAKRYSGLRPAALDLIPGGSRRIRVA
jgi:hypothetical protein